ncbi:siderophore-interacting protein [Stackebrandtia soli]|uniref:siderophore-interacting protein n=1 Tax=Stackebrandtia soli TaxID=1892856 RepID=UPI0039EA1AE8
MTQGQSIDNPFLLYAVRVTAIKQVSPTFRRFTFAGPDTTSIADTGYDQRMKLIFPLPGKDFSDFPMIDNWYSAWRALPNDERPPVRTYTLRNVRPETGEFDVDIALHGRLGPASTWASDAVIGDEIIVTAPNSRSATYGGGIDWHPPAAVNRVLLVGDETSAPAIAGILERLDPSTIGAAVLELPDAADAAIIGRKPDGVELTVLGRGDGPVGSASIPRVCAIATELVEAPIESATPLEDVDVDTDLLWEAPTADVVPSSAPLYAWLAGEAVVIKTLRRHLVTECGVDRRAVAFMGYWRHGRAETN